MIVSPLVLPILVLSGGEVACRICCPMGQRPGERVAWLILNTRNSHVRANDPFDVVVSGSRRANIFRYIRIHIAVLRLVGTQKEIAWDHTVASLFHQKLWRTLSSVCTGETLI